MTEELPYNPLDKRNLGKSVAEALLERPTEPLPPASAFTGAGIYAIYYSGDFKPYREIAVQNQGDDPRLPIYIGKAVPAGSRKGGMGFDVAPGQVLYNRLNEHGNSIESVENLKLADFRCRYLVVDDIWIPLGESLLIKTFFPIWNLVIDGYGNHDPGKGRYQQQRSPWDVIHPGREWAFKCAESSRSKDEILTQLKKHLAKPSLHE